MSLNGTSQNSSIQDSYYSREVIKLKFIKLKGLYSRVTTKRRESHYITFKLIDKGGKNQMRKHLREDQKEKRKSEKAGQIAKTDSRNKFKCNHNV